VLFLSGWIDLNFSIVDTRQPAKPALEIPVDTGLRVVEVAQDEEFLGRVIHTRDTAEHMEGMQRIARVFVERPEGMLQELVDAAVVLCGADSAGITGLRQRDRDGRA
jgi:hypothetical protein